jgi:hypothetical protein
MSLYSVRFLIMPVTYRGVNRNDVAPYQFFSLTARDAS